jgi:hypothetical protein
MWGSVDTGYVPVRSDYDSDDISEIDVRRRWICFT